MLSLHALAIHIDNCQDEPPRPRADAAADIAASNAVAQDDKDDDEDIVPGPRVLAHVELAKTITRKHVLIPSALVLKLSLREKSECL